MMDAAGPRFVGFANTLSYDTPRGGIVLATLLGSVESLALGLVESLLHINGNSIAGRRHASFHPTPPRTCISLQDDFEAGVVAGVTIDTRLAEAFSMQPQAGLSGGASQLR